MSEKDPTTITELLDDPTVLRVTDNINPEMQQRRNYSPPKCAAFDRKYTILKETGRFRFTLDPEARRQLPDIIENKVQLIEGVDEADEKAPDNTNADAISASFFRGGPHRADTMSLPACFMRPNRPILNLKSLDF